jgi:hypothetical protein
MATDWPAAGVLAIGLAGRFFVLYLDIFRGKRAISSVFDRPFISQR